MPPTVVRAPIDQQLPFGTPTSKFQLFGRKDYDWNIKKVSGAVTVDAVQINGFEMWQDNEPSQQTQWPIVGIRITWWTRLGETYSSAVIGRKTEYKLGGFIDVPYQSSNIVISPFVDVDSNFGGIQVTYVAPNNQTFTQNLVTDVPGFSVKTTQSITLQQNEVLTGITQLFTDPTDNGIQGLDMQISRLPFGVQHNNIVGPSETVTAKVAQTDDLIQEQVDNTGSTTIPLTAILSLLYNYQNAYSITDTSVTGIKISSAFKASATFKAGFKLIAAGESSIELALTFEYNQTAQKDTSDSQLNQKTYTTNASVTVPPGKKCVLSLTAYKMTNPGDVTFQASAQAVYYWYNYLDGSVIVSDPLDTTLQISNVHHTQNFIISQDPTSN